MKASIVTLGIISFFAVSLLQPVSLQAQTENNIKKVKFPYKKAGLTPREAAAHLLNRFSYGATPGQIDDVVKMGLENWFYTQLQADLPEDSLHRRLDSFPDRNITNSEVLQKYPRGYIIIHNAVQDSAISKDSVDRAVNKKAYNEQIQAYMKSKGYHSEQELYRQFISEHIIRSAYANNQLKEVMVDFWFNHFNVSFTKSECSSFIPAYERDAIRPNVLGKFDSLLLATAKSPAMSYYLDNVNSQNATAPPPPPANKMMMEGDNMMMAAVNSNDTSKKVKTITKVVPKNVQGLNENYAREVMELHTLGVDGGYTQSDVTQAAKILTGWTVYPISTYGEGSSMKGIVAKIGESNLSQKGFVRDGDFLFTPNRHDKGEKTVLGRKFPANGGYQEGVDLLEMLAHHPSTAKFIANKLAVRFVTDNPSATLIDKMAKSFTASDGNIQQVLLAMVASSDFWGKDAVREKTKSPFELTISAVRCLNADIKDPNPLFNWVNKMGQKIYYYQAPTGFPDRAQYWINTGSLLNRMNFGLALASNRVAGITVNLKALNENHEPESADAALVAYSKMLMPERKLENSYRQLAPLLKQPDIAVRINEAATKSSSATNNNNSSMNSNIPKYSGMDAQVPTIEPTAADKKKEEESIAKANAAMKIASTNMLSQVVGIIIGSPEFQRR